MNTDTKITIRQLQIFLCAIEHRSFAKAAQSMGLAASAVSMQMTNMGNELGVTLFEKDGRSIRPTPVATAMLPYAERMLETLDGMVSAISALKGEMGARVRISMVSTARNFGPHLIQAFRQQHPEIEVEVSIHNRNGVILALQNRQVDAAIMGRMPRRIEVEHRQFARHPYVLIAGSSHPLCKFRNIKRADLVAHKFLLREPGSGTRMVHDHFFTDFSLPLPMGQEMDSNANIKNAVMAGMGLAFMSAHTIGLEKAAGKLQVLDVEGMPELRDWYVVTLKGASVGPAAGQFVDFVGEHGSGFMQAFFDESA